MRVDGLGFDIPELSSNPFSAMPLEGSKSELYVGRLDIRGRLSQHIKFRSTRRILMVGDLGSGRTSLLRCSALEAPVSVHIDHISASNLMTVSCKGCIQNLLVMIFRPIQFS